MVALVIALTACATPPAGSGSPSDLPSPTPQASFIASEPASLGPGPSDSAAAAAAWSQLDVREGPSAREDHTWTIAGDGSTALLFGGRDGSTVNGDLWSYDLIGDEWTRIESTGGPAPRFGHEAAWVDGIGLVIFAGQAGATFFNDLWAFDPEREAWEALPSSGAVPVPRYGTCMALGPDGRLWISHGFTSDGTRFADTRAWDPVTGTWSDETPAGDAPTNRCLHGCWWTDDGRLALFGGQTTGITALDDRWVLDDGAWTRVAGTQPAPRNLYARARVDGATAVLGGQALDGSFLSDGWWLVDGADAAAPLVVTGDVPPARAGAEMVVDVARDRLVLFGGRNAEGTLGDLWELNGVSAAEP